MKIRAALLGFVAIGLLSAQPTPPVREGTEKDVQVARLSKAIPKAQAEADQFIWDSFSKRPETRLFYKYSTKEWRTNYARFSAALVDKAKGLGYEWESLRSCLAKLPAEPIAQGRLAEVAYLPIGAYRTTWDQREVWVVFCLWEDAMDPSKVPYEEPPEPDPASKSKPSKKPTPMEWPTVGHIRMFTYDLTTLELIGFVTCD